MPRIVADGMLRLTNDGWTPTRLYLSRLDDPMLGRFHWWQDNERRAARFQEDEAALLVAFEQEVGRPLGLDVRCID